MLNKINRILGTTDELLLHNRNETFLFPDVSNVIITFTAGAVANAFGAWVEIVDSLAVTLSSRFAAQSGHISEVMTYNFSIANEIWIIEIAYGAALITVGRQRVRSDWTYLLDFLSRDVPAGEIIYGQ